MSTEKQLTVMVQKQVQFYGDELIAIQANDGQIYVSVRHLCDTLGLDSQAQTRRLQRHTVLSDGLQGVANLATPGGLQKAQALRADLIPLWLSGLRVSMVKEEIRPKLERFQREAAKVLWEAFQEGQLNDEFEGLLAKADRGAVEAYHLAQAMLKLARNQIILQAQVQDHAVRLERLEAMLGQEERLVTPEQASQISQAVKAVAIKFSEKTGRNEFGGVYGELYRQFGITSYKQLPAQEFDRALAFLTQWYKQLTGLDTLPF